MKEAVGYGLGESPYYTEQEQRQIAATALREGTVHCTSIKMVDLFENYLRITLEDASDMTMQYAPVADKHERPQTGSANPGLEARALEMALLATKIVENGGEYSEEQYIGAGSEVQQKAQEYLPLVLSQRKAQQEHLAAHGGSIAVGSV